MNNKQQELEIRAFALTATPMTEEEQRLFNALTKEQKKVCPNKKPTSLTKLCGGAF